MCSRTSPWSLNASPLSPARPLALVHPAPVRFTWTHAKPLSPRGPTDGDVEAVDAEGGTPTLPETLLLGVGFHGSAPAQSHSHLMIRFNAGSHSQCVVPVRSGASPPGWKESKKKKKKWRSLTFPAERRHLARPVPDAELRVFFYSPSLIFSLSLPGFSHLGKFISKSFWLLFRFACLVFLSTPPSLGSAHRSSPGGAGGV